MPDRYRCRVENTVVRPERRDTLEDLVWTLFERRHHDLIAGREKDWLRVELVQSLREQSRVYREELSSETEGPLPFALGYFKVRDDTLDLVSDEVPANVEPKIFVRFLSEFLRPGARFWFSTDGHEEGWAVRGIGEITALSPDSPDSDHQPADSASADASS
ncbi:MAG: hypothetical protein ABEK84_10955 [Salinibacter sp.]